MRFDPDVKVREAALNVAGDTYASLLFILPMLNDVDADIADKAVSRITDVRRPQAQLQKLNASEVVRLVELADKNHPNFIRRSPKMLLLLAQFKRNTPARRLLNQLIKSNLWDVSIAATPSGDWNKELVTALVARYEVGGVTLAQALKVLDASPKARAWFAGTINLLTDETLLRYAISLLYDTTLLALRESEDVCEQQVYKTASMAFCLATGIELNSTSENGIRRYAPKDIVKLYKFYGLQTQPNQ